MIWVGDRINNYEHYAYDRYGNGGLLALSRLDKIKPGFQKLIVDPGLMIRLDQFEQFVAQRGLQQQEPWAAREAFRQHLGDRIVYRALVLTPSEHQNILKVGLESSAIRSRSAQGAALLMVSLQAQIRARVKPKGPNGNDPLLSVSDHPEVASSASTVSRVNNVNASFYVGGPFAAFSSMMSQSMKQTYLYTLKVPEIDLFYRSPNSLLLPSPSLDASTKIRVMTLASGVQTFSMADREVESFMLLEVDPSEIVSARALLPMEIAPLPGFSVSR